jgi:histidinol-phosphate aminotransferase
MRVGYAIGAPGTIEMLDRAREPYNVGRLAQVGAAAAIRDAAHREATRRLTWAEKRALYAALTERGLGYVPTDANFVLVDLRRESGPVVAAMRRRGVLVRDGAMLGVPRHLRITIGTPAHNQRMLAALDAALDAG